MKNIFFSKIPTENLIYQNLTSDMTDSLAYRKLFQYLKWSAFFP